MKVNLFGLFLSVIERVSLRPFEFLGREQKNKLIDDFVGAVLAWQQIFERNSIDNPALQSIMRGMKDCLSPDGFDELSALELIRKFINNKNCLSLRQSGGNNFDWSAFDEKLTRAVSFTSSYHHSLEMLKKRAQSLSPEFMRASDMTLLEKIGVFYVLEYTIFLLKEIPKLNEAQRTDLFYRGITIGDNKMMPYQFYAESFYNELCLKIYDDELRNKLLEIFFTFKELFAKGDIKEICDGFKVFNLRFITEFKMFGLVRFKTVFLNIFDADEVSMDEAYEFVKNIDISGKL